jgi:hypothetical protein
LQILFELIEKGGTVKGLIEEKDLVQASCHFAPLAYILSTAITGSVQQSKYMFTFSLEVDALSLCIHKLQNK